MVILDFFYGLESFITTYNTARINTIATYPGLEPRISIARCPPSTSTSGSKIISSKFRQFNIFMTWGTIGFLMYTAEVWIFRLRHVKPYVFFFLDRYATQQRWTFASIFTSTKCGQFNICVIWVTTRSWMYAAEICWQIHDALYKFYVTLSVFLVTVNLSN